VRVLLAIALLAVLGRPARADIVAGLLIDATHLGGIQAGGADFYVESAIPVARRLQLFGQVGVGYLAVGVIDAAQSGAQGRLAAGVRWRPITWGDPDDGGVDLYVEAAAGANGYWWGGHTLARPDADLGWGFQVRAKGKHRTVMLRSGIEVLVSTDTAEPTFACRGCKMGTPQAIDGGMLAVFGMAL